MGPDELMAELDKAKNKNMAGLSAGDKARAEQIASVPETKRVLSPDEQNFIDNLAGRLPVIIARKEVPHYLGGIVSPSALASADSAGRGPEAAYKIGVRMVAYETKSLLEWVASHYGITRLRKINHF